MRAISVSGKIFLMSKVEVEIRPRIRGIRFKPGEHLRMPETGTNLVSLSGSRK